MQEKNEFSLMIAGESGMGIESVGEILMQLLSRFGYWLTAEREYASLIKYGQANVNIHVGTHRRTAMTRDFSIGLGLGRSGIKHLVEHLVTGGILLYNFEKTENIDELIAIAHAKGIQLINLPTRSWLESKHWSLIMENTILIGGLAKILDLPFELVKESMTAKYGKKASLLEKNIACLGHGYQAVSSVILTKEGSLPKVQAGNNEHTKRLLIDGNTAIALGAIQAGVSCYFAYPMSPSSSILTVMAESAEQTGILVRQVEDEISAAQMTLGASYNGARAMTATSGGGFDLMTETVSLAGMIEVPLVICIAMRPGPATGLPTWTAQGDLRLAIYGGHGEFARIVIAVSDPESAFLLTQYAHNLAEQFQVPVILLTDKHIAENIQTVPMFPDGPEIGRFLQNSSEGMHRYEITESGVSPRWLPRPGNTTFFCNGDEHTEDGVLDESVDTEKMIQKRIRKLSAIEAVLPDPVIYGNSDAQLTIIGRGSTKNVMMDLIQAEDYDGSWIYIHVEYMWPMRKEFWNSILNPPPSAPPLTRRNIAVLETNATGQFGDLLQQQFGVKIEQRFCKTNGRAFYREEVEQWIQDMQCKM